MIVIMIIQILILIVATAYLLISAIVMTLRKIGDCLINKYHNI